MNPTMELVRSESASAVRVEDFMPVFTVKQAVERKTQINQFISGVMTPGEDYGTIPGGQTKRVLLKPGAEKLCSIFGMSPRYALEERIEDWKGSEHDGEPFFYYRYTCQLYRGDRLMGEAAGSCNSWESKYRYRSQDRKCPVCGNETIIKGKKEYGGGFLCFMKKGGCGAKFLMDDPAIVQQSVGKVPNPDVADQVNTVLKMAQKRALIAAVLVVTNCSDAFTQDIEDNSSVEEHHEDHPEAAKSVVPEAVIPAPLRTAFENLSKPGAVKTVLEAMRESLASAMPQYGESEYKRILADNGITPGGARPSIPAIKKAVLQMWDVAEFAKAEQKKQEAIEGHPEADSNGVRD